MYQNMNWKKSGFLPYSLKARQLEFTDPGFDRYSWSAEVRLKEERLANERFSLEARKTKRQMRSKPWSADKSKAEERQKVGREIKHVTKFRRWLEEERKAAKQHQMNNEARNREKIREERKSATVLAKEREKERELEKIKMSKEIEASMKINSIVKGFIVRTRLMKIRFRIHKSHGDWKNFINEYKGILQRVQKRYGKQKISTPFNTKDIVRFMSRKEKYDKTFYNMAVGDKLAKHNLMKFFRENSSTLTERQVNIAFRSLFQKCQSKADIFLVSDFSPTLSDTSFRTMQTFLKEFVRCLHISTENVRIGFSPFNTDVFEGFDIDQYGILSDILKGLDFVKYSKNTITFESAFKKAKEGLQKSRRSAPKIMIIITDFSEGGLTIDKQSLKKDEIKIIGVNVGDRTDESSSTLLGKSSTFQLNSILILERIRFKMYRKLKIKNCQYCNFRIPEDFLIDMNRPLHKHEIFELAWTLYPPSGADISKEEQIQWIENGGIPNLYPKLKLLNEKVKIEEGKEEKSLCWQIHSKLDMNFDSKKKALKSSSSASWEDLEGMAEDYLKKNKKHQVKEKLKIELEEKKKERNRKPFNHQQSQES
ncbi:unnamed protein product [Dimorphilus gyrociliatus]|uniref:VWFA domain-containing protein n=1 Tax=Dimorphilus gyrociliatus TaxID=2664684 RepID=A0A7I8VJ41_9ANNE|nr:unnamed protein product [Dimorphilus gyrociliatus]